jgi:transposase
VGVRLGVKPAGRREHRGDCARNVSEVARELGCDWHTVNDALGLDEVLFCRRERFRRQEFSTSIVDVTSAQLLDVVPGRSHCLPA